MDRQDYEYYPGYLDSFKKISEKFDIGTEKSEADDDDDDDDEIESENNKFDRENLSYLLTHAKLSSKNENIVFEVGMRYGNPSIPDALLKLQKKQVRRLLVLPMYPQYCAATTGSTFDEVTNVLQKWRWIPEMRFINQYFEEKNYIEALSNSIKSFWKKTSKPQKIIFSVKV